MRRPRRLVPGGLRVFALPRSHDAAPRGVKTRWRALLRLRADLRLFLRGSRRQGHAVRDFHESEARGRVDLLSEPFSTICSVASFCGLLLLFFAGARRGAGGLGLGKPREPLLASSAPSPACGGRRMGSSACGPARPLAPATLCTRPPTALLLGRGDPPPPRTQPFDRLHRNRPCVLPS